MIRPQSYKVLISAYACRPFMGSEAEVGWSHAQELAKDHQVWVITRSDNRFAIEAELAQYPNSNLQFIYHNLPWSRWWNIGVQLHYYLWQLKTYFVAHQLHTKVAFDILHHVTYVKYWSPSFLALLPVPLIWGPVGGAESTPKKFRRDFSLRGKAYEIFRDWGRWLGEHDPFVRLTAQKSQVALATTQETATRLSKMGAINIQIISEVGFSDTDIANLAKPIISKNFSLKFVSMGRLLHWKGFHLGLKAFKEAKLPENTEYWILGAGPEYDHLKALSYKLDIVNQVKFWGQIPRAQALLLLKESHALIHPSLHDSGGWVCLEAMAIGRPVICLDWGGPGTQVTKKTGIKIAAQTPDQCIHDLATAMTYLATNSELRTQMGNAGKQRVREYYHWTHKRQIWREIYTQGLQ